MRWVNRRVVLTVTDQSGKTISDGGIGPAIENIQKQPDTCCQDILKRLDKLDEIAQMLRRNIQKGIALDALILGLRGA